MGKRQRLLLQATHLGSMGDMSWDAWLVEFAEICGVGWSSWDFGASDGFRSTVAASWAEAVVEVVAVAVVVVVAAGLVSPRSSLFPSETRRFSRPSTRFNRASRTSVLGPLFFGTASVGRGQLSLRLNTGGWRSGMERTIDTRAVEDLTGFAGWAGAVAFDLWPWSGCRR